MSARHQVNGWIVFRKECSSNEARSFKTGPAEETGFLRSVRVSLTTRSFTGAKARYEIWS